MLYLVRILLFCVVIGTSAAACSAVGEVNLDAGDDGSQIELNQGQFLVINLERNPTTGYTWEAASFGDQILRQVDRWNLHPIPG